MGGLKFQAFLAAAAAALLAMTALPATGQSAREITGTVTAVPSGDEVEVDGVRIRLQGIAAPGPYMPFGGDAAAFMQLLVMQRVVTCRLTGEKTRGREVGICEWEGVDIARVIVREGLARDCPRFSRGRYAEDERKAKITGLADVYPLPDYCGMGT